MSGDRLHSACVANLRNLTNLLQLARELVTESVGDKLVQLGSVRANIRKPVSNV
jgi:hypothetical protein